MLRLVLLESGRGRDCPRKPSGIVPRTLISMGPKSEFGNFDFRRWDATAVGSFPEGESAFGLSDLIENGWEWTSTFFAPFKGFSAFPFYRGYSADFFDDKHYVLKGGSARTAASMLRRSF